VKKVQPWAEAVAKLNSLLFMGPSKHRARTFFAARLRSLLPCSKALSRLPSGPLARGSLGVKH